MRLHYKLYTINSVSHRQAAGTLSFGVWDVRLKPNRIYGVMRQSDYDMVLYDVIQKKHECVAMPLLRYAEWLFKNTKHTKI